MSVYQLEATIDKRSLFIQKTIFLPSSLSMPLLIKYWIGSSGLGGNQYYLFDNLSSRRINLIVPCSNADEQNK